MNAQEHIEETLQKFREIFEKISGRIEKMKPGEKVLATALAGEVAGEYKMSTAQIYPIFLHLIRGYPGIEQKRGAKGGIIKLGIKESSGVTYRLITPIIEEEDSEISEDALIESFPEEDKTLPIMNT